MWAEVTWGLLLALGETLQRRENVNSNVHLRGRLQGPLSKAMG